MFRCSFLKTSEEVSGPRSRILHIRFLSSVIGFRLHYPDVLSNPACKNINVLAFKISKNQISGNDHWVRKIVFESETY